MNISYDALTFYLGAISAIAIFAQLFIIYKTYRADHERRKKQATIEAGSKLSEYASNYGKEIYKKFGNKIINLESVDEDSLVYINGFMKHAELFSVGVNTGVYDIQLVDRMFGSYLMKMNQKLGPYISNLRKTTGSNSIYIEFEHLCDKIKSMRSIKNEKGNINHS